jgi:hypothetical protein
MKTTINLVGIIFLGGMMGLETYTKVIGEKPVAVAINIQQAPLVERPAEKPAMLTTDQAENVSVSRFLVFKEEELKRQQQHQRRAAAAKEVNNIIIAVSPKTLPLEQPVENIALPQLEAALVAPAAQSPVSSDLAPPKEDSTATAPKKKRKFLGIFPLKDKR